MTLIDIAGKHKCHETALYLLDYCMENFTKLAAIYGEKVPASKN